jgi:glycosyltransferase involved in cell wall biosynthesis/regulator of replication initiation timing
MKILIITENFKTGGLETQITGFCRYLKNSGHEIYLISGIGSRTLPLREIIGDHILEVDMRPNLSTKEAIKSINRVASFAKEIEVDILHLHPFTSFIYGGIAATILQKPYVVTLHGPLSLTYGYSANYRLFLEIILKDAWRVFCVSKELSERIKLIVSNCQYVILPNAIDIDRFKPAQYTSDGAVALVLRLDDDKLSGVKHFLKLWAFLPEELRKPVHIFGEGHAKQELERWMDEELVRHDWITLKGHEDNLEKALASGYSAIAGMGRVILEALAMELPAILVGYDGTKGVVNLDNIEDLAYRNFSGRYLPNIENLKDKKDVKTSTDEQVYPVSKHKIEPPIGERYFPTEERLRAYLGRGGAEQSVMHMKQILSVVPEITEQDVICDIGCANGAGSKYLSENVKGTVLAFDLWNWPSELLEYDVHQGLDLYNPSTWDLLPKGKTFILSHTIEHLEDPWAVLDGLIEIKKPGMVVINVPYNEVIPEGAKPPEHIHSFNGSELRRWAVKSSAKSLRISHVPIPGTNNLNLVSVFFFDRYELSKGAIRLAEEVKIVAQGNERSSLRKWVEEHANENTILLRYIKEIQNPGIKENWWTEALLSSIGEADDISLFGDKVFHCLLNNLPQNQSNYHWANLYLAGKLNQTISEKDSIWNQLNQTITEKDELRNQLNQTIAEKDGLRNQLNQTIEEKESLSSQLNQTKNVLNSIYASDFWRVASFYYKVRDKSIILRFIYNFMKKIKLIIKKRKYLYHLSRFLHYSKRYGIIETFKYGYHKLAKSLNGQEWDPYSRLTYLNDQREVILIEDILQGDQPEDSKMFTQELNKLKFSVVCPVKNEEKTILLLLKSISEQSIIPSEFIIVDGDSEDKTVYLIKEFIIKNNNLNIKLLISQIGNISFQRNKGVEQAENEIIMFVDAGNYYEREYFKNMLIPFIIYENVDMVGGIRLIPPDANSIQKKYAAIFSWDWNHGESFYKEYLPHGGTISIKKSIFYATGGFPEWLTYAGEDTLFDINYMRFCNKIVINKKAKAYWIDWKFLENERALEEMSLKKAFNYGKGDGESAIGLFRFYSCIKYSNKNKKDPPSLSNIEKPFFNGFLEGYKARTEILINKRKIKGNILILSGVPITDSGGGQRCTQIAIEFMHQNYKVTFVNIYPSFEPPNKVFLDSDLSLLECYFIMDFIIEDYLHRHKDIIEKTIVIVEFPHPALIPILKTLKKSRVKIVYDYIDNWSAGLGWDWYDRQKEDIIVELSDYLIATDYGLCEELKSRTSREVIVIPNGYNSYLFNPKRDFLKPSEFEIGRFTILYSGALWGNWFDWELLKKISENNPEAKIIVIGNYESVKDKIKSFGSNVAFTGLISNNKLPAYIKYADVCIIPFIINKITQYTNPIKVYEYIAMNKPVVSTNIPFLATLKMEGLFLANTQDQFLKYIYKLKKAFNIDFSKNHIKLETYSWMSIITKLIKTLDIS